MLGDGDGIAAVRRPPESALDRDKIGMQVC
jgi:hypothetical protein